MEMKQAPQWLGTAPEFDESKLDEIIETDVVVCGAGIAGVCAVRTAAEAGADCVIFEKCDRPQGRSGQFGILGSNFLKHWYSDTGASLANEIAGHLARAGHYRVKQSILQYAMHHIGEDFDWYLEGLPKENVFIADHTTDPAPEGTKLHIMLMRYPPAEKYDLYREDNPVYPYTVTITPSHVPVLLNNMALAEVTGCVRSYYKMPVRKLLRDPISGRVTGVIAQGYDGKTIKAVARKGVILTTGDYSCNPEMFNWYFPGNEDCPHIPCGMAPDKQPANVGDGHRMGMWIGAKMEDAPHCINSHNMGDAMGTTPYLQLDLDGRRFMNEDCTGQDVQNRLGLLKGKTAWQFFDSAWPEQIPYMPVGHGACSHILDDGTPIDQPYHDKLTPMDSFASQKFIDRKVASGSTLKADTLEALLEKTGLPMDIAMASIARYNELARKGCDDDFGKKASRMFPLEKGPFYAARITRGPVLCGHSGLESDEYAHCLDEERNVIPGLYVAGNVQGNRFAIEYPTTLPGLSHTFAITFGRRAAKCAVDGI